GMGRWRPVIAAAAVSCRCPRARSQPAGGARRGGRSRREEVDSRREAVQRLLKGAGSGQRRQVLIKRFLQSPEMLISILKASQRLDNTGYSLAHLGQRVLLL